MFPVFSIIFDQDVEVKIALQYPQLYQSLQKGRNLNAKTFLTWVWKATYQGSLIIILSLLLIKDIFLTMETVAFTSLILTEYVMIMGEVKSKQNLVTFFEHGHGILNFSFSLILHLGYLPLSLVVTSQRDG